MRETGTDLVGAVQVAGLPGAQGLWSVRAAPGAPTVVTPRADDPDPRGARA
ncbi:hypothetical protein JM654_08010 [Microbacterium oxydans]|nr:hypothetical protein [Microbacterium oxydans]